jgi:hypothetical protein
MNDQTKKARLTSKGRFTEAGTSVRCGCKARSRTFSTPPTSLRERLFLRGAQDARQPTRDDGLPIASGGRSGEHRAAWSCLFATLERPEAPEAEVLSRPESDEERRLLGSRPSSLVEAVPRRWGSDGVGGRPRTNGQVDKISGRLRHHRRKSTNAIITAAATINSMMMSSQIDGSSRPRESPAHNCFAVTRAFYSGRRVTAMKKTARIPSSSSPRECSHTLKVLFAATRPVSF